MNAYVVTWGDSDDVQSRVTFADDEAAARRTVKREHEHDDTVTVRREPRFDEYASAGRVPAAVLLAAGWCLPCGYCCCERYARDDAEDFDDGEAVHPDDAVTEGHRVWCSTACRDADALRRAWREALVSYVRAGLPHATRVSAHAMSDGWSVCWSSPEAPHPRSGEYVITATGEHYRCEDRDEAVYARDVAALRGSDAPNARAL